LAYRRTRWNASVRFAAAFSKPVAIGARGLPATARWHGALRDAARHFINAACRFALSKGWL